MPGGELVLVTGASGFIAAHVVQQLQLAGYRVRGTVRNLDNEQKVKPLREICPDAAYPLELVEADLLKPESWVDAVEGCTYVCHTASPLPVDQPKNEDELIKPAVEGTLSVLRAAKEAKCVKRVVLTGSVASMINGYAWDESKCIDEENWTDPDKKDIGTYPKSKTLAEKAAWDFVNDISDDDDCKFELVVLNPSFVIGPVLSGVLSASMEVIKCLMQREMPMITRLHFGMIDVRDVAAAHVTALTADDVAGKRHILCNGAMWLKEIGEALEEEFKSQGYNIPLTEAPYVVMWLYARFDAPIRQLLPSVGRKMWLDNTRMREVLNIEPRPLKQAVIDMAYSMIEKGMVKKTAKYKGPPSSD